MNVLIDLHHTELHESLLKLFQDKLGFNVYTPLGYDWAKEGYWNISDDESIIQQFLFGAPEDKTLWHKLADGEYYRERIGTYRDGFKFIELKAAKEKKWDIVIATHPSQFEFYKKFIDEHCPTAKLVFQMGNMMGFYPEGCKNILNSTSNNYYLVGMKDLNCVNYTQEFDYKLYDEYSLPKNKETISSYVLFNQPRSYMLLRELSNELKWPANEYGAGNRDGHINGDANLAESIKQSGFVWHYKLIGDGFGHVLYKSFFAGRPVILNYRMYQYHRLMHQKFLEDGITCINCNDLEDLDLDIAVDVIAKKVRDFYSDYDVKSKRIFERIRELVDFDKEYQEILKFLDNLR